jgi:uncharacterized membrane protein
VLLLILKLTLAPGLVAAVTLAGRRWGPRVAGWLGGLPVVVGPVLLALAVEHGDGFAARAAAGALLGLLSLSAFVVVYAWAARWTWWLPAVLAGWAAAAVMTFLLEPVAPPAGVSLVVVCAGFALTALVLPRSAAAVPRPAPRWDVALRAGATAAIVLALTGLAGVLGARLAGMLAAFPVLASVLAAFTHAQDGADATASLLRGMVRGLVSFAVFCFVVAVLVERSGIGVAFAVATAAALVAHAAAGAADRTCVHAPASPLKQLPPHGDTPARTTS